MYRVILNTSIFNESDNSFEDDENTLLATFDNLNDALDFVGKDLVKLYFYLDGFDLVITILKKIKKGE